MTRRIAVMAAEAAAVLAVAWLAVALLHIG